MDDTTRLLSTPVTVFDIDGTIADLTHRSEGIRVAQVAKGDF